MKDIGVIGLGVMGKNLSLNIANKGFSISVFNNTATRTENLMKHEVEDQDISDFYEIETFVHSLIRPRKIILMIKAGEPVDSVIESLLPYLDKGDLIIDGGNTYYHDTTRRMEELKEKGILYLGLGISGGESGALNGPSLMPGGSEEAYDLVKDILLEIAAESDSGPCCTYVGNGSAGHFTKMMHNGIEYGMMQLMAETFDILRKVLKLSYDEIGDIFETWNNGELNSYLMEIAYKIMRHKDKGTGKYTVDIILDKAGQKGTGKWTSETAINLGIPTPSLIGGVVGRSLSYFKEDRIKLSKKVIKQYPEVIHNKEQIVKDLENSLLFSNLLLFSQGLWLIAEASVVNDFNIDLCEVLRIWKGGCIIRAKMLDSIIEILQENRENVNLLHSKRTLDFLMGKLDSIKNITSIAKDFYIPTLVHNSSIDYFFSMIEGRLPANFLQAQRDFFGAHTYERIDMEGIFHTNWE